MATTKTEPLLVLRSDTLNTDLVQYLSARYLVTVEAQENEIIYELFKTVLLKNERSNTKLS